MSVAQPKKSSSIWCCGGNTADVVDPQVKQSEEKASAKSSADTSAVDAKDLSTVTTSSDLDTKSESDINFCAGFIVT